MTAFWLNPFATTSGGLVLRWFTVKGRCTTDGPLVLEIRDVETLHSLTSSVLLSSPSPTAVSDRTGDGP